jgi:hypothetical protein
LTLWGERGELPQAGTVVRARITLNNTDRTGLSCAVDTSISGYRCEFAQPGQRWPPPVQPAEAERLAPYLTTRRALLLVPGLFENPAVARRYQEERERVQGRESRRRFEADCEFELVEKLDRVAVRLGPRAQWETESRVWLAVPRQCQVAEAKRRR